MHEDADAVEPNDSSLGAVYGRAVNRPSACAASDELVIQLKSAVGARSAVSGTGNLARRAARAASALAKRPICRARVTAAVWPPLAVPSAEAQCKPVWTGLARVAQGAIAEVPLVAPKDLGPSRDLSSPIKGASHHDEPPEQRAHAGRAFAFRPGDRVVPDLPQASLSDVHAAPLGRPSNESEVNAGRADVAAHGELAAASQVAWAPGAISHQHRVVVPDVRGTTGGFGHHRRREGVPWGAHLRTAVRWMAKALAIWFGLMLGLIVLFRFVDPPGSTLMAWQALTGTKIDQRWVPLSRISSNLKMAVVVSEDGRFCQHWGVDPAEVVAAIRRSRGGMPRGASTITMQVAKNLFLWPSKSYVRKALEVPLSLSLEVLWPKSRILEVYLNIAEWGPGVFGAEAAARHHFGKSASRLSSREAALLAVALPNPISRRAGKPGPGTTRLASLIQSRMRVGGHAAACVLPSR